MNKTMFGEPALLWGLAGSILMGLGEVLGDGFDGWGEVFKVVVPLVVGFVTRQFVSPVVKGGQSA